jgi:aspartate/methionine/tyrosine aminotransferase
VPKEMGEGIPNDSGEPLGEGRGEWLDASGLTDIDDLSREALLFEVFQSLSEEDLLQDAAQIEHNKKLKATFGFLVTADNPFVIFRQLQELAKKFPGEMLDLSRGNPGLGSAPAEEHRRMSGFLNILDTGLNPSAPGVRINEATEATYEDVREVMEACANEYFHKQKAEEFLEQLDAIINKIIGFAAHEGITLTPLDVLKGFFQYSAVTGGTYHATDGEQVSRIVVADMYRRILGDPAIHSGEIIFTSGVNDGIGTLFKMLGKEGMGYLRPGDSVAVSSPAYAPYFSEIIARGLVPVEIRTDPTTGEVDLSQLDNAKDRIKAFFIINPNNPTGLPYDKSVIEKIAGIARDNNSVIITDEIYAQFHEDFTSVWTEAKERTILLSGRSKIERGPGLRFGDVLISDAANAHLTELFRDSLDEANGIDFKKKFIHMKGPGGAHGSFHHTASVPGPSQMIGTLSIVLGAEERAKYVELVNANMEAFHEELGIPRNGATYYSLFDLNRIPGNTKKDLSIEQKLSELAERGVILVPAVKFFSEASREESDKSNFVRAALANVNTEGAREAARRIREYIQGN